MRWLRRFATTPPGAPRVVCFPHAGGAAGAFVPLAKELAPHVEVLAVQYPGRQDRRQESTVDLRTAARLVVNELAALPPAPTTAYFGHSMGAIVAFEAALLVRPEVLFASAARAPSRVDVDPGLLDSEQALVAEVLALGATSARVLAEPDLRAMVLPPLRSDYRALLGYPGNRSRIDAPIVALVGDADPRVAEADALVWADHTTDFTSRVFRGDHFYLIPGLREVARVVGAELAALV
ncbi:alpha/beta fold hydrolase [Actinokineospora auranticolor]|uniref:Surfactin synthase thioesterase subunit n=1 Tax=Actinokineospora auranticolor TaxID=155976 RepID=A0A2S6H1N3_9PSEU|nr:alpha/beta fold hydrolase [Actinokineospora auranticolor]PPK71408.1 surfactin synthase thioesterase subunit [Actinokineospora auranticolor]